MLRWIKGTLWKAIFWWKKRTGFIDFKEDIEVVGTVMSVHMASDGDVTFNIYPDEEYIWSITWYGGLLKSKLHCEVPPWISESVRDVGRSLKKGDRVKVSGAWGFDGVHVSGPDDPSWEPKWYQMIFKEIPMAIVRHQPNVHNGWFEIHPVKKIEKL